MTYNHFHDTSLKLMLHNSKVFKPTPQGNRFHTTEYFSK